MTSFIAHPKDCPLCCGAGYVHIRGGEKDPEYCGKQDRARCPYTSLEYNLQNQIKADNDVKR